MIWPRIPFKMVKPFNLSLRATSIYPQVLSTSPQYAIRVTGRMLSQQAGLAKLPVPALNQTLDKFLKSVKPLYGDEEYKTAEKLVADFSAPGSDGDKLQTLLQQRAAQTTNWLSEWWTNIAYLDFRMPCPIHVNPGILMMDQDIHGVEDQIKYAANWSSGVLDYKRMVDDQSLPVEYQGKSPLCMDQYFKILNACRIPGSKRDSFVVFTPDSPNPPKHISVLHNNHIFSVRVYGDDNKVLSRNQLEDQFRKVIERSPKPGPPVGVLTADGRDEWAKVYQRLSKDDHNKQLFDEIHRSIFVLCLDKAIPPQKSESDKHTAQANQMNHGMGSAQNSCNRWFDKTIQFVVGCDGAVGANYEHCSAEGPPILAIIDHAMNYVKKRIESKDDAVGVTEPKQLQFNLDSQIEQDFGRAISGFDSTIRDLDMVTHTFDGYGKEFPKSLKVSPDALVQISIQLTHYRLYKRNAATYESGSLRRFQEGRTDTIRSCSVASDKYCRAMLSPDASAQEKVALLKDAVASHRTYTNEVVMGQGIDRHLLGLKLAAMEHGLDVPAFLTHPTYTQSCHWRISTSQVPSKHNALLTFAPVVTDGYGICYNPMPHQINFCVSAWKTCSETDARTFLNNLIQSLEDARSVLLQAQGSKL